MTKKVSKAMVPGTHGSTFGGNPLAMSVGNAVMDEIFKKGFLSKVKINSKYFISELNNIKNRLTQLKSERSNKIRMVQVGDYEYDRYNAHKKILKTIVYGAFILLILSYLFQFAWFPNRIGGVGIVLTISWVIISISSQIYDNARRDNIDYEKYDQGDNSMYNKDGVVGVGDIGFFNRNADSLKKLFDSKCKKDGFRNMGGFSKVIIPADQPTTYAPITIY